MMASHSLLPMDAPSKPTTTDRLLGLCIISRFMLLITAIPLGIVLSLQQHYKFDSFSGCAASGQLFRELSWR